MVKAWYRLKVLFNEWIVFLPVETRLCVKYERFTLQRVSQNCACFLWAVISLTFDLHFNIFNPFPNKPWLSRVCFIILLKTQWEKEKLLVTSNFSFSHSVFFPFWKLSAIFIKFKIVVCKLFQFGRV